MNFSNSDVWNSALFLRYPIDRIKKIGKTYFYDNEEYMICQSFFEPSINESELDELKSEIANSKIIKFNYINNSVVLRKIKNWATKNNFTYEVLDSWNAPQLTLDTSPTKYFINNCGSQVKRNYKNYKLNKNQLKYHNSDDEDTLKLWDSVLKIDFDSWKKSEKSDMKSLNREDLQYLPLLLLEKEKSSLVVAYDVDNNPLAYSLMFKGENNTWYAAKWGASNLGRKKYAGFSCLFNHLEFLYNKNNTLQIDFWGRRNKTYDSLKNRSVIRKHILIYKKED